MGVLPNPGDEFGEYHIVSVLGRGGMGVVYTAVQRRLDRTVALKVLSLRLMEDPEQRTRFVHEAAVLSQLDSPHITHIYDTGEVNGCLFIATQLVRGGDLGDLLHGDEPLGVDVALDVTMQIASALDDAHSAGVVHRDVKPSNVLLRDGAETFAYLCDFGIARSANSLQTTATGHVTGTWAYLAPERVNGASASARTDIYSLGCLLWAALTGEAPYQGSNEVHVAFQHTTAPIPQLVGESRVEQQLNAVLVRSMAKRPEHRYERAGDMRTDLAAVAELVDRPQGASKAGSLGDTVRRPPGPSGPLRPSGLPDPVVPTLEDDETDDQRSPGSRRGLAAGIAVALLVTALGTVGTVVLSQRDDSEPSGTSQSTGSGGGTSSGPPTSAAAAAAAATRRLTRVSYDGDERSDVAIQQFEPKGVTGPSEVVVLRSNGDALEQPEPWRTIAFGESDYRHRLNGDFDGDDKTDAAVAVETDSGQALSVLRSTGRSFGEPEPWGTFPVGRSDQIVPISGDFDGDGAVDMSVSFVETDTSPTMKLSVLRSDKDSFLEPRTWATLPWDRRNTKLIPGDLDGDGMTDFLVVRPDAGEIECSVLRSNGDGFDEERPLRDVGDSNWPNVKPLVGDFNGDRTTDVLIFHDAPTDADETAGVETLFLEGDGAGGLRNPVPWFREPTWTAKQSWVSVGDFNADGADDVARIAPSPPTGVEVWILQSTGSSLEAGGAPWGGWPGFPFGRTRTLNRIG